MKSLKEWASIVRALEAGKQTVLLRKGGILDTPSGFRTESDRFLLFPTREHQGHANIRQEFHHFLDQATAEPTENHVLTSYASIMAEADIASADMLDRLSGFHIWSKSYIDERRRWRPENPVKAMFLRVYHMPGISVPPRQEYQGCRSWIDIDTDMPEGKPVMTDAEISPLLRKFREITA